MKTRLPNGALMDLDLMIFELEKELRSVNKTLAILRRQENDPSYIPVSAEEFYRLYALRHRRIPKPT
jgi:hypothetical protein